MPDTERERWIEGLTRAAQAAASAGDMARAAALLGGLCCIEPEQARAWFNLALARQRRGDHAGAVPFYRRALVGDPDHLGAGNNLCDALLATRADSEAADWARHFRDRHPETPGAWVNLGLAHARLGQSEAAVRAARSAHCLAPELPGPSHDLAVLAHAVEPHRAAMLYRRAMAADSRRPATWMNLGTLMQQDGHLIEARGLYEKVLAEQPDHLDARANLGAVLLDLGDAEAAIALAEQVLARDPEHRRAQWLTAWISLLRRDFENGYRHFDRPWRDPEPDAPAHARAYPLWEGGAVPGGRLLLWCEHGIGDEILYAGMLDAVLATGVSAVLECDPRLVALFRRSFPELEILARGDPVPCDITVQSSTARLPILFRRTLADFPDRPAGYLVPDPARLAEARAALARLGDGPTLGLAWRSGNPRTGAGKSTYLSEWDALLALPALTRVSLQYDDGGEADPRLCTNPWPDVKGDIDGLAAQIAALDQVVSISGVTAHLAGALGRPTQVLLPSTPVWFWFDHGADCPWYPTARLHRPDENGARGGAIGDIARLVARAAD